MIRIGDVVTLSLSFWGMKIYNQTRMRVLKIKRDHTLTGCMIYAKCIDNGAQCQWYENEVQVDYKATFIHRYLS